jgi:hypothetical protein
MSNLESPIIKQKQEGSNGELPPTKHFELAANVPIC